jgi:hypothetical protein
MPGEIPRPADAARLATVWEFIAAVRDGTARPGPDDFDLAVWLVGWFCGTTTGTLKLAGLTEEQADAQLARLIEQNAALYGSLAASGGDL